jgi:hypothetical protein
MCPGCGKPTFWASNGNQTPGPRYGQDVEHLPPEVSGLYDEARNCLAVHAHHAAVMIGRKILMHAAVAQGAEEGKRFVEYVDYLRDNNLVPPGSRAWVDEIREIGNDANHEISEISEDRAKAVVDFVAMLLQLLYQFPERARQSVATRKAREQGN